MDINALVQLSYETALAKGWWDEQRGIPELLALIHSEVSEALTEYRMSGMEALNKKEYLPSGKPSGFTVELADIVIRIADLCGRYNLDLDAALTDKLDYNKIRPYRHGDLFA